MIDGSQAGDGRYLGGALEKSPRSGESECMIDGSQAEQARYIF